MKLAMLKPFKRFIPDICTRSDCKMRCPLSPVEEEQQLTIRLLIRLASLVLMGMLIGALALQLHGQTHGLLPNDREAIAVAVKVEAMETSIMEMSKKLDALKSEADTTEAMGVGIGLAITGLQLLGFFAKSRDNRIGGGLK